VRAPRGDCLGSAERAAWARRGRCVPLHRPSGQIQGVGGRDPESGCAAAGPARQARRVAAALC